MLRLLQELIAVHPVAYATVSARLISVALLGFPLVIHCAVLALFPFDEPFRSWSSHGELRGAMGDTDGVLRVLCAVRVLAGLPRPYAWWRIYTRHMAARQQPTQLRVALRCMQATRDRWVISNQRLNQVFTLWLAGVGVFLFRRHYLELEGRSLFEQALMRHAVLCAVFLGVQKVLSVGTMLYLIHSGAADIALTKAALERGTEQLRIDEALQRTHADDPCIICWGAFEPGDSARRLRCGHVFHTACIDSWLLEKRPRGLGGEAPFACPICSASVDAMATAAEMADAIDDPRTARELEWIAAIRQRNLFDA